jgi:hypothetical protein
MSYSNQVFKNTETGQLFDIFTKPTTDIIPSEDLTYDLGSASKNWNSVHTGGIWISGDNSLFNKYKEQTYNSCTVGGRVNGTIRVCFTRVGNMVTMRIQNLNSVSVVNSASNITITFTEDISDFKPDFNHSGVFLVKIFDGAQNAVGLLNWNYLSTNRLDLAPLNSWSSTATAGFDSIAVSYLWEEP